MFESVKQGSQIRPIVYVTSLLVSLAAHALIICVLVLVPLIFFGALQAEELISFIIAPPAVPAPPPIPTPPVIGGPARHEIPVTEGFVTPVGIPERIPAPDEGSEVVVPDLVNVIPGVSVRSGAGGNGGGTGLGDILSGIGTAIAPPPPPPPRTPIRVGILYQSKLVRKVNPIYPDLARRARVTGDVILEAVIDEEGSVSTIKILKGHPLLVQAAVDAVIQWKYSPTVLSGEPVPILATITVTFRLSN